VHLGPQIGTFLSVKPKLVQAEKPRTWVLVFGTGDDPVAELRQFASQHGLPGAHFTGIGAFRDAVVAFFEWEAKRYRDIPIREQVEVLSLAGDIAEKSDGTPVVHAHVVLGRSDGSAVGGHLQAAHVLPTLELVLEETPAHLVRVHDPESGLALIDPQRMKP
jgi:predicted DNA-binding protein with PD1-like motif